VGRVGVAVTEPFLRASLASFGQEGVPHQVANRPPTTAARRLVPGALVLQEQGIEKVTTKTAPPNSGAAHRKGKASRSLILNRSAQLVGESRTSREHLPA
jgi:hypothetical protein